MKLPLFSPLLALALATPLAAQITPTGWIGDDGFNTTACCDPVQQINVPLFPPMNIDGLYCCIKDCDVEQEFRVRVTTQHIPLACDVALIPFSVTPIAGTAGPGWVGTLLAKYARTWVEPTADGLENQVWRFLVNTEAVATAGAAPCPIPPHPAGINTHFTGNIDYACTIDPTTGALEFRMAMNLNHLPGCISHNIFSASPLLPPPSVDGHHDRSYHLVAPGSFVCEPVPAPEGFIPGEAVRSTILPPLLYTCLSELFLEGGDLQGFLRNCLCPTTVPTGPMLWTHSVLSGFAFCPTPPVGGASFTSLPVGPPAPPLPTGFTTFPVGRWVGTDPFPGSRELNIHFGLLNYMDPCLPNQPPFHIVTGVSTTGPGGLVFGGFSPGPFPVFTDLQNMILANGLFGPYSLGFGTWFLSSVVWNLNL